MVAWTRIDQHRYCAWKIIKKLSNYSAYLLFCPIAALKVLIYCAWKIIKKSRIASIIRMPTKSNLFASSNNKAFLKLRSEDLIISAS